MVSWGKLIFGGVDSSEYGIYITGEGVYNAPERAVEFVDVPGRNGAIAIDQGRYENISVTYPAGVFGKDPEEFREVLSEFRNAILSQKGYQRLEDTYHPEEFREAIYAAGLEVEPSQRKAGRFELTFNCKPQRWISAGALPIPVDSGDILQNPTLFETGPMLEIEGYGNVNFNGYTVSVSNATIGNIDLVARQANTSQDEIFSNTFYFDRSLLNEDDVITVGSVKWAFYLKSTSAEFKGVTYSVESGGTITPTSIDYPNYNDAFRGNLIDLTFNTQAFTFGALNSSESPIDKTVSITMTGRTTDERSMSYTATIHIICGYDYITYRMVCSFDMGYNGRTFSYTASKTSAVSTLNVLGHPTYIDCEMGEAYRVNDGEYQSLNKYVSLGSDLPTLAPGLNKITFSNTITDIKIIPRWWRL